MKKADGQKAIGRQIWWISRLQLSRVTVDQAGTVLSLTALHLPV